MHISVILLQRKVDEKYFDTGRFSLIYFAVINDSKLPNLTLNLLFFIFIFKHKTQNYLSNIYIYKYIRDMCRSIYMEHSINV